MASDIRLTEPVMIPTTTFIIINNVLDTTDNLATLTFAFMMKHGSGDQR